MHHKFSIQEKQTKKAHTEQYSLDRSWPTSLKCHWCPVDLFFNTERAQLTQLASDLCYTNHPPHPHSQPHPTRNSSRLSGFFRGAPTAYKTEKERNSGNQHLLIVATSKNSANQASSTSAIVHAQLWTPVPRSSFPTNLSPAAADPCLQNCQKLLSSLILNSGCSYLPLKHHQYLNSLTVKKEGLLPPTGNFWRLTRSYSRVWDVVKLGFLSATDQHLISQHASLYAAETRWEFSSLLPSCLPSSVTPHSQTCWASLLWLQ